jgi:hypothetical protein
MLAEKVTFLSCIWADRSSNSRQEADYPAEGFIGLLQVSKVNSKTLIQIRSLTSPQPEVAYWLRHCATSRKARDRSLVVSLGIFSVIWQFHVPGVDSASKNEYQDTPRGKDGRALWLTTYHFQVSMSQNLEALTSQNPLGPIGL